MRFLRRQNTKATMREMSTTTALPARMPAFPPVESPELDWDGP